MKLCLPFLIFLFTIKAIGQKPLTEAEVFSKLAAYNVEYKSTVKNSKGSMPLGNGDVGLNVWTEDGGDLCMYISKTDAWSENVASNEGLLKIGKLKIRFTDTTFQQSFRQLLQLHDASILIHAASIDIKIWIDANAPIVHIETNSAKALPINVQFESLRNNEAFKRKDTLIKSKLHTDTILNVDKQSITWLYENKNEKQIQLKNLKFGAQVKADGLISKSNPNSLENQQPSKQYHIQIAVHSEQVNSIEQWLLGINKIWSQNAGRKTNDAFVQHAAWWRQFWLRSWIFIDGNSEAKTVSKAYNLQRFVSACAGRGKYPIKFNGSVFTMDMDSISMGGKNEPKRWVSVNGDYRDWGGRYWFQNTRHLYWPMLPAGDFDMMQPFFNMYANQASYTKDLVKQMYGIENALVFGEQQPFWGGISSGRDSDAGSYPNHHFSQVLEYSIMGLEYFHYTQDAAFLKQLMPIAQAGLNFYKQRFKTDSAGKLLFYPCNALETFWKAKNPSSDIAGFRHLLDMLLALPKNITSMQQRQDWQTLLSMAPEIPLAKLSNQSVVILPALDTMGARRNSENTELCPIFPFKYFGLGKPGLDTAINTFKNRMQKRKGCWHWDVVNAALLGLTNEAKAELVTISTVKDAINNKGNGLLFPVFWGHGHDYWPDEDQGGVLMAALQFMLLQQNNGQTLFFPAWPKEWNVDFKLKGHNGKNCFASFNNGKVAYTKIE